MAASPAVISFTSEKWVKAITDLMALTQKSQLLWQEESAAKEPYPGPCYVTEFNGNTLILQRKPLEKSPEPGHWFRLLNGVVGSTYTLRAFKPDGELLTTFPSVAALNGLKIAIDAQLQKEEESLEDSFLREIHQTAKNAVRS